MFNQPPSIPPISNPSVVAPRSSTPAVKSSSSNTSLIKTVVIILLALTTIGLGLLSYYFYNEYRIASTDVESQVNSAVITREKEITDQLEKEFAEREKDPYNTLSSPDDYGSLSLKYPKTWSVYVARDASSGGDYEAILHPGEVVAGSSRTSVYALHVEIKTTPFDRTNNTYKSYVENGSLTPSIVTINGIDANRYDGTLPSGLIGSVVLIKIRDKTAVIYTDADIYRSDFNKIIQTITFNQ